MYIDARAKKATKAKIMQIKRKEDQKKWSNNKADRNQQEVKYHGQIYVCTHVLVALDYAKRRSTTMQGAKKKHECIK